MENTDLNENKDFFIQAFRKFSGKSIIVENIYTGKRLKDLLDDLFYTIDGLAEDEGKISEQEGNKIKDEIEKLEKMMKPILRGKGLDGGW